MKKNKLILLQVFIILILVCTSVYAASTTIGISASNTTLNVGDTVTVTLSLEDVDNTKKVESIEGYINYNTDVIEAINVDSIQKNSDNTVTIGEETLKVEDLTDANISDIPTSSSYIAFNGKPSGDNNSKIVIDFQNGISEDCELIKIDFKVKSNATTGDIKEAISYSMFVITAGSEQSEEITKSIDLTVKTINVSDEDSNQNLNGNVNNNSNTNSNSNRNTNSNSNSNSNRNSNSNSNSNSNRNTNSNSRTNSNANSSSNTSDNTASGVLPATGAKMLVIPAVVLGIVAYISYNKYMKYKDI